MAKSYITLDTRIDAFKDEFNSLVNKVGDIAVMSTSGTDSDVVGGINNLDSDVGTRTSLTTTADQNLVVAINEHRCRARYDHSRSDGNNCFDCECCNSRT